MRLAIDFDRQAQLEASEIGNVAVVRELAPEPKTPWTFAELLPEDHFRQCHLSAKLAGTPNDLLGRANGTMPCAPLGPSTTLRVAPPRSGEDLIASPLLSFT